MTTSCFSRLSLTKLYLATQQNKPGTLTKTSLALSHLHPQVFSFAHHEGKPAEWEFFLTAHASVTCCGGHTTFFFVQSSFWAAFNNLPVPERPIYLYHSVQHQSFPVGLGFKPALTPSPTWSSGWGLLGCWQISAERWLEGKPGLEFGPVHQVWLGRGPRAGRCWRGGLQAAWDSAVGLTVRELDQTIVRWRQQWECSGWTGAAGAEVEWRKQEGGTASPCAQLKK